MRAAKFIQALGEIIELSSLNGEDRDRISELLEMELRQSYRNGANAERRREDGEDSKR